jgi:hypothetical protein
MKPIPDWPGYYAMSDGRIFSERRLCEKGRGGNHKPRFLSTSEHEGYMRVTLWKGKDKKCFKAHRLVALAWIPNPGNLSEVNHINGVRGDNRAENLEWVSASGNRIHQYGRAVRERDYWKDRAQRAEAFLRTLNLWLEDAQ